MSTILLKNARLCDGDVWEKTADILVEDGRIAAVGSGLTGDTTVDMSAYAAVLPGIIDAHMHIVTGDVEYNDVSLRNWARAGVTTVRDLGLGNPKPVEDFLAYRKTVDNPECARCLTCGRFVTADHGYCHIMPDGNENGLGVKTPEEARRAVNYLLDAGCEGIKTALDTSMVMPGMPEPEKDNILTEEDIRAIVEECKKRGVWCCAHVLKAKYLPTLIAAGIPELAHMPTDYVSDELIDQLVNKHIAVTPTLCTIRAERIPMDDDKKPGGPGMGGPGGPGMGGPGGPGMGGPGGPGMGGPGGPGMGGPGGPGMGGPGGPGMGGPGGMPPMPDPVETEKVCIDNVARFFKRGGLVAVGTDTMRMESMKTPVGVPVKELELLSRCGMGVQDVIAAATKNAAAVCGLAGQAGTLSVGAGADIIAVKSPLEPSFEALSHVEFVMNKGVIIKQ